MTRQLSWAAGLTIAMSVAGCAKVESTASTSESAQTSETDSKAKALAGLSAEDKALVAAQKICPVAGGELGGMGKPIKVHVKDRDVFVCCEGCIKELESDPEKYLAKIDAAAEKPAEDSVESTEPAATDAEAPKPGA